MNNVIYKWYYSADGSDYQEIYASSYTASKSFVLPIQNLDKDKDNGYYRVKIGESGSFESDICSIQGDFRVNETRNKKLVCLRHGEYNAEYNISADDPDIYDGMEIDINSSLTIIIRIIKPRTQTVTFDENGGTCAVETNAYAIGEQYGWLPEAAWQGHMFLGWWAADPDGAGEVPVATTNIVTEESARTLWARWAVLPSVSNVVARQRWPWNGLVDVDYEVGGSTNLLAGVTARITFEERIEGGTGRIWVASNFLAGAEPSVEPGPHRATWDTAADGATNVVAAEVVATVALVREEPIVYNTFLYEIGGESVWSVPHPLYGKDRDGKYLGYYYLDSEFKFRPNAGDWNGDYEFAGEGRIADNGGANCPTPEPSFYRIQVDLAEGTYALEAVRSITMVGTHNSWNVTDLATHMSFDREEGCWTIGYTFAEQTSLRFAMNDDWTVSWGGANGDASNYGDLTENNGKDLSVASGKYRIKLYLSREGSNRVAFVPKE
jgi:hypothetical protein